MNKTCSKCLKEKQLSEFYKDKNNKTDGRYSICRDCKNEGTLKWRVNNREKYNKGMRDYWKKYRDKRRDTDYRRKYGSSLEEFNRILIEQDHKCAICGKLNGSKKRTLAMDHHHETLKRRGLLCYGCNRNMHLLDNSDLYAKTRAYAEFWLK